MLRTIEVEIDAAGQVHPVELAIQLPAGPALLTLLAQPDEVVHHLAQDALAADWLRSEEDAAWAHLQRAE